MSTYNAIVSVLVHFESYRNIDLMHQGLYYLSATLISEDKTDMGLPIDVYHNPYRYKPKKEKFNYHNVFPARANEVTFCTRTFTIRYCEEEVELCDLCEFRIEIPADKNLESSNCVLEFQLHFADLNHIGGAEELPTRVKEVQAFKSVATHRFIIRGVVNGVAQYIRVQSGGHYFGMANVTIHSALIDFRYRPLQVKSLFDLKSLDSSKRPSSFCEYLFADTKGRVPEEVYPEVVDRIYAKYASALVDSFAKIKSSFLETAQKCLTEQQRRDNSITLTYQELVFPESEETLSARRSSLRGAAEEVKQRTREDVGESKEGDFDDTDENAMKHSVGMAFRPNKMPCAEKEGSASRSAYPLKSSKDPYECANKFALSITNISGQVIELWHRYIYLITASSRLTKEFLYVSYMGQITANRWGCCVLKTTLYAKDFVDLNMDTNIAKRRTLTAQQRRALLGTACMVVFLCEVGCGRDHGGQGGFVARAL